MPQLEVSWYFINFLLAWTTIWVTLIFIININNNNNNNNI